MIREECFPHHGEGHELCRLLFINHFGTDDYESVFANDSWIEQNPPIEDEELFVVNAVTQGSPDGLEWSEVHHIIPRGSFSAPAHLLPQRSISHRLHSLIEAGEVPNIEPARPIFHCLNSVSDWAADYTARRSSQLPHIPSEPLWIRRVISAYHSYAGSQIAQAVEQLDNVTLRELYEYVWFIREHSWTPDGIKKDNICPSDAPPNDVEWAIAVIDEVNGWYRLSDLQKTYLRRLAYIVGPYSIGLLSNGMSWDTLKEVTSTYRSINPVYTMCLASNDYQYISDTVNNVMEAEATITSVGERLSEIARENRDAISAPERLYYVGNNYVITLSVWEIEGYKRNTNGYRSIDDLCEDLVEYD